MLNTYVSHRNSRLPPPSLEAKGESRNRII